MNGITGTTSLIFLSLPKSLVRTAIPIIIMTGAQTASGKAVHCVKAVFQASGFCNAVATVVKAVLVGVPTAPNGTGIELNSSATIAAANGGKPTLIRSGAQSAAGVPKPAAPSIKPPKMKPMIIACKRASGVIPVNMRLIALIAPDLDKVFMIRIAPKIITSTSNALRKPVKV